MRCFCVLFSRASPFILTEVGPLRSRRAARPRLPASFQAHFAPHRLQKLQRIVAHAIFEDDLNLFDIGNVRGGIAMKTTRSACLPGSIAPICAYSPRNRAP